MKKVFLGGTCNDTTWRKDLIKQLKIDYFNPVVDDWTPDCMEEEFRQREICDYCLYVITPKMTGVFSIAEVVDDSNKCPEKVLFHIMKKDGSLSFNDGQMRSLNHVKKIVINNGAVYCSSLKEIAIALNKGINNDKNRMV